MKILYSPQLYHPMKLYGNPRTFEHFFLVIIYICLAQMKRIFASYIQSEYEKPGPLLYYDERMSECPLRILLVIPIAKNQTDTQEKEEEEEELRCDIVETSKPFARQIYAKHLSGWRWWLRNASGYLAVIAAKREFYIERRSLNTRLRDECGSGVFVLWWMQLWWMHLPQLVVVAIIEWRFLCDS